MRQADPTLIRFEDHVDLFWQHISDLNQKADDALGNLKAPQLNQELE